jgi:hypothetical protein
MSDTVHDKAAVGRTAEFALCSEGVGREQMEFAEALGEALVDQWLSEHSTKRADCKPKKDS